MKRFMLFIILLFVLSACQSEPPKTKFIGETENWKAIAEVKTEEKKNKFILQYKGNEINSIGEFEFKLSSSNGQWGMGAIELNSDGTFKEENKNADTLSIFKASEKNVTIKWNDKEETFSLN
ncbi:membrane lipoprotein lipid attachment site-containing protein [Metabacillus indicus]|uniref:Lipocalin-like domain-containing protein n=1 Tax=Metabacillus indicus TaxID=246786 RepID=A0A084GIQ6_METID|nr:membrane lipoprotein lipid attachment site-containing protein [Metabacillus indicus]KEZ47218.1 hypothetical protein GS18_0220450 [Metabacillus indicus]